MEINETILKALKQYSIGNVAYAKVSNGFSESIEITKRQGCSQRYVIIQITNKIQIIGRTAKEWECQLKMNICLLYADEEDEITPGTNGLEII